MVVMILLLGTALLNATRQQLAASLALVSGERQHIIDFYAAQAALAWGGRLRWTQNERWQCQREAQQQWRACLRHFTPERALLRGEMLTSTHQPVTLWQWLQPDTHNAEHYTPFAHGWLDFCPLADAAGCQPDAP